MSFGDRDPAPTPQPRPISMARTMSDAMSSVTSDAALLGVVEPRDDPVDHPKYYNQHPSGVECIDIVEHLPFNVGAAIKYLWRAGLKDSAPTLEDYRKSIWYVQREIERLQKLGVVE